MGFPARSLVRVALLALVLTPAVASAQGAGGAQPQPPPPGGGSSAGSDPAAAPAGAAKEKPAGGGNVGGVSFNDKPTVRRAPATRVAPHRGGPLATFPGFEQLPDGGSRLFVQLSQTVPVEERRAQGSVTYVLKGAHLRVHNDTNALVTVHFNTPVFRARLTPQGNDLLFVLELRSAATPTFKMHDNQDKSSTLQIDFAKGDFLRGDGSESLPSERVEGRGKRGDRKAGKGAPAPSSPNAPPPAEGDNGTDNGPNP